MTQMLMPTPPIEVRNYRHSILHAIQRTMLAITCNQIRPILYDRTLKTDDFASNSGSLRLMLVK